MTVAHQNCFQTNHIQLSDCESELKHSKFWKIQIKIEPNIECDFLWNEKTKEAGVGEYLAVNQCVLCSLFFCLIPVQYNTDFQTFPVSLILNNVDAHPASIP